MSLERVFDLWSVLFVPLANPIVHLVDFGSLLKLPKAIVDDTANLYS